MRNALPGTFGLVQQRAEDMPVAAGNPDQRRRLRVALVLQCRMRRTITRITRRELRNESGRIMRALDRGRSFVITRNGVPVGELIPLRQRMFVAAEAAVAAFRGAPPVDLAQLRKDLDAAVDQDPTPRG